MNISTGRLLLSAATGVVIASVVAGLVLMGSPGEARSRQLDRQREGDLRAVVDAIDVYWERHDRIPESLDALTAEPGVRLRTRDPATSEAYGYRVVDEGRYELCATFAFEGTERSGGRPGDLFAHGSGRQCFELEPEEIERR